MFSLSICRWMNGWIGGWMDACMDGWMDGWMGGWINGWMDGWMEDGEKQAITLDHSHFCFQATFIEGIMKFIVQT
jgi:hypothetical protein